jgi:superfamily I DNA/RNA helicase
MNFTPNPEQQACIDAVQGDYVVIAGPGSGKTATLIQRYLNMITTHCIPATDILNLTFTNSAATEMVQRVGLLGAESVFRTFHSFALDLLKRERAHVPFTLTDTVIPVYGEDFQLMKNLLQVYPAIESFRSLKDKLSEWKRSNIEPDKAKELSYYNGTEFFYACAYADYEKRCREQGWLDFDDCIVETIRLLENNNEVRARNRRRYISVDEAQDCDTNQFWLLQLIYGGNIFVVGDENQCQPPGTLVVTEKGPVPIESLKNRDKVQYWNRKTGHTPKNRFTPIQVVSRDYSGDLIQICCDGKTTQVTPDHQIYATLNIKQPFEYLVYLMWRSDLGFRIGQVHTAAGDGSRRGIGGFSSRCYEENANKAWVLHACKSKEDARMLEVIEAAKFGLPTCVYTAQNHHLFKKKQLKEIFKSIPLEHGFQCLKAHGLLFNHPLFGKTRPNQRYFKTAAANLIAGLFSLPTSTPFKPKKIESVKRVPYQGKVYSLNAEKYHTYVADGLLVCNCIYEWRSAKPNDLTNFYQRFPGAKTLYLGQNYRSTRRLTAFFKQIIPMDNGLASHMVSDREEGVNPVITKYADEVQEAHAVLNQITDPANTAIIARTNRQVINFQKTCMARDIKSKILGRKNLWQQTEVRHLLELAKEQKNVFHIPATEVLIELIHSHNMTYIYRHSGGPNEPDPIENLNNIVKLAANRGTVAQFLEWLRKLIYARKSDKNPVLSLTTVHQAKGREWKHVFVVGCNQGLMPHKDGELLEEHRIFFVAASRAADSLHISYYGSPSQFLNEFRSQVQKYGE